MRSLLREESARSFNGETAVGVVADFSGTSAPKRLAHLVCMSFRNDDNERDKCRKLHAYTIAQLCIFSEAC